MELQTKTERFDKLADYINIAEENVTKLTSEIEEKKRTSAGLESGLKEKNNHLKALKKQLRFESKSAQQRRRFSSEDLRQRRQSP